MWLVFPPHLKVQGVCACMHVRVCGGVHISLKEPNTHHLCSSLSISLFLLHFQSESCDNATDKVCLKMDNVTGNTLM